MHQDMLILTNEQPIINAFKNLKDPRVQGRCDHKLIDIIVITFCAIISGAKYWEQIEEFGRQREPWFRQFLDLDNGIPSYKTFNRVFSIIPADEFEYCFRIWSSSVREKRKQEVIAIDGKTLRNSSHNAIGQKALHLINAYATQNGLTLAVEKTPDKSNEIKGIPKLLKSINIEDCVVTIDAMGCQKGIANLIRLKEANYVLALKKNHKRFYKKVELLFQQAEKNNYDSMVTYHHTMTDSDHSRGERREYSCLPVMYLPLYKKRWKDLDTFIKVKSIRHTAKGKQTSTRYYISSLSPKQYLRICSAIREHWHIENRLHWKLDVSFKEDQSRTHARNGPQNLSSLRKMALFYLESEPSCLSGLECKQWKAALSIGYLEKVIGF